MANETKTTSLPGIANSIRAKSYEYFAQTGVMKGLVTKLTGVGTQFEEPYFDPTATAGVATATEGTDYSTLREISTTRRTYTASEWIMMTFLTDQSRKMSAESVKEFHSKTHGYEHAYNLENKLLATFASFTTSVTATSTTGLTWAKLAAARTRLEDVAKSAPKPYALVTSADAWYYFAASTSGGAAVRSRAMRCSWVSRCRRQASIAFWADSSKQSTTASSSLPSTASRPEGPSTSSTAA